ncbi:lethal(2) giant larvae protein homolog SRO77 isoform X2 [Ananas comosus]|uniref:Lethal(2) giant larvae protein homolog SRO77 isoform X2 n=1 Tax=Ananas comosus TaxID=4615 RepID=A0A6P5GJX2_ANACO|nr:lethal(2) giant larvae protein homolog SRO77 isoform X2 [Ananas comosus]
MFAKRLLQKALRQLNPQQGHEKLAEMDLQIAVHYGIPYTASDLRYDPIQRLLAIGTLDGRIKIIGGDNIEGLLISPKKVRFKHMEFLHNKGYLVAISNDNEVQVWNLEFRQLFYSLHWEVNITAFAVVQGTCLMYLGDENGLFSVLKFDIDDGKLQRMPYQIPINALTAAGISSFDPQSIVGILPQPYTSGTRVLIAYEKGLLVLWDISQNQAVAVRGYGALHLKGEDSTNFQNSEENKVLESASENEEEENAIGSLCWASSTGTIVAVGYVNGDIVLWNMSSKPPSLKGKQVDTSPNIIKLELASGNCRLPVIVLHWSAVTKADNEKGGHLFIYGGDDKGSEEVLTVVSLEYSGMDTVRCVSRSNLNLNGSFADMILIPEVGSPEKNNTAALFVLTNPGQLNVYDGHLFSMQKFEGNTDALAEKFPDAVPTIDPRMTVTKLCSLAVERDSSKGLLKKTYARKAVTPTLSWGTKWPLTGGVPSEMSLSEDYGIERLYIAGYQDGSVRIWDATFPVLAPMFLLEGKVPGIEIDSINASVSSLAFCSMTMTLAVGNECGLVRIYKLHEKTGDSSFHFVGESKEEVQIMRHGKGFHFTAAFLVSNSHVQSLQYTNSGEKLAVGFENGQVAMLDMNKLLVMFCKKCVFETSAPVISLNITSVPGTVSREDSPKKVNPTTPKYPSELLLTLYKNATLAIIDSTNGVTVSSLQLSQKKQSSAISMYVIDVSNTIAGASGKKSSHNLSDKNTDPNEPSKSNNCGEGTMQGIEEHHKSDVTHSSDLLSDPLLLICCENVLRIYSLKSLLQGNGKNIRKVKLAKRCCWSTLFKKIDEITCGLLLVYDTGAIEIRSLPDLEVIAEQSLMSLLRWSFKTNMDKTMSSTDNGQIALVNGSELAIISLLACENDFRIPDSLPCLHDKVLAAAAEAAINASINQKKKQDTASGILGGIMKGFKGSRTENSIAENILGNSSAEQLEEILSKVPFLEPSTTSSGDPEVDELSIDDIEIDDVEPSQPTYTPSEPNKKNKIDEEREKLFDGSSNVTQPRVRTTQEILTQYRFGGDAAAAAAHARDKLVQRQEKLERLSQRTAELQSGAEDFASMANELVKTMENKKWWKL